MAANILTEPLLPRGRDDRSTAPAHAVLNIAAATPSATTAARAARSPTPTLSSGGIRPGLPLSATDASGTNACGGSGTAGSPPPTLPSPGRGPDLPLSASEATRTMTPPARAASIAATSTAATATRTAATRSPPPSPGRPSDLPLSAEYAFGSASKAARNAASPRLTPPPPRGRGDLPPCSSGAFLAPEASPTTGTTGLHPLPSSGKDISDNDGVASPPPPQPSLPSSDSYASPSLFRSRNSPRSTPDEIIPESVGGGPAIRSGASRNITAGARRGRSGFRVTRSGTAKHRSRRAGLRIKPRLNKDFWSKESFIYTCVLMVFAGLVAYLGTMIVEWVSYLKVTFIIIFGVATGLACTGAMAVISDRPVPSPRHFAPIVSRLTFLVASLAFEGAVFYLLGEIGFLVWLVVACGTVFGMAYFWRAGHPDSLETLLSGLGFALSLPRMLFDSILALVRRD